MTVQRVLSFVGLFCAGVAFGSFARAAMANPTDYINVIGAVVAAIFAVLNGYVFVRSRA